MINRILKSTVLVLCFLTLSVPAFAFTQSALKNLEEHGSCSGCDLTEIKLQGWDLNGVLMKKHGFVPYSKEWWHFTYKDEPFPDTYFDLKLV